MMGGYGMHGYGGGMGWFSVLAMILLFGGLGFIVYGLLRRPAAGQTEELHILRLRLAKGEITPEEFDLLREKLAK